MGAVNSTKPFCDTAFWVCTLYWGTFCVGDRYGFDFAHFSWVPGVKRKTLAQGKEATWDAFSFDVAAERKGQNASAATPD